MPLIKSLTTTTLNSLLTPIRAGGIVSSYVSAASFFVDSAVGIHVGDKFKVTGGADRYGTVSDITGLTVTAESISDSTGAPQPLHTLMNKVFIGYSSDIDSPINSSQVVNSKATAKRLKVRAGRVITVLGDDGGDFYGVTGAAALTYADDDPVFCGTKFIPNGSDGSSVWRRLYRGEVDIVWFGAKVDGIANDTAPVNTCIIYCNVNNKVLTAPPGTCLITPGGITADVSCSVNAPYTVFKAATAIQAPIFSITYSEAANSAGKLFNVGSLQGSSTGTSGTATGLYIKHSEYSRFVIRQIHSLNAGVWLGGLVANSRIARNDFVIGKIHTCADGLYVTSGIATSLITELNTFNINSIHNCSGNLIHLFNSSANIIDENVFNINALEINVVNAVGIRVSTVGERNTFNIAGVLNGESGTGKLVIAAGTDNIFNLPTVDWVKITDTTNLNKYYSQFGGPLTFTATLTGCTTTPTITAYTERVGNAVIVNLPSLTGTSNSTAATFTGLPAWAWPTRNQLVFGVIVDNSSLSGAFIEVQPTGVIKLYPGFNFGVFVASGAKGIEKTVFTYLLK